MTDQPTGRRDGRPDWLIEKFHFQKRTGLYWILNWALFNMIISDLSEVGRSPPQADCLLFCLSFFSTDKIDRRKASFNSFPPIYSFFHWLTWSFCPFLGTKRSLHMPLSVLLLHCQEQGRLLCGGDLFPQTSENPWHVTPTAWPSIWRSWTCKHIYIHM